MTAASAPPPTDPSERTGQGLGRDYLVRSEEQLRVGTERVVAGYARLEKFTVTQTQSITVEVTHEEVRLVQTAAGAEAERQGLPGSQAPADGDRWMVLSREEVVVSKRVVPVERVRLEVYPVIEQRQVTEQVRKEQIDTAAETAWTSEHDSAPVPDLQSAIPRPERTHPA